MADKTKIEWSDATWQPITGCSVESPGCTHCYAMKLAGGRLKHHPSRVGLTIDTKNGPVWNGEVRLNDDWLNQPIRWRRRRMIFVCAHSDLFHPSIPDDWIDTVFGIMWACLYGQDGEDGHIFQVLTKRSARMREYLSQDRREHWARAAVHYGGGIDPDGLWDQIMDFEGPHPRIWLGVSVEDQKRADERIPDLLATPAAVRWVSFEPLLGQVDATRVGGDQFGWGRVDAFNGLRYVRANPTEAGAEWQTEPVPRLDWAVVGFESGQNARPGDVAWARLLRDQCEAAGVPFLYKQHGEWISGKFDRRKGKMVCDPTPDHPTGRIFWTNPGEPQVHLWGEADHYWTHASARVGKAEAGRLLDGKIHDGYPVTVVP
ncbi:MAG: phage Gp37/Gp68 family protein [Dechloromonas agitata]|uniref:Phage Gp37/Gp68 family protein n=1 Tax=Dechloromonas agitata TaxID=73030 RepID=A0A930FY87_9RHOO|nr:phage Gp37/Gp68 family protein [Dechloromonas agitata]